MRERSLPICEQREGSCLDEDARPHTASVPAENVVENMSAKILHTLLFSTGRERDPGSDETEVRRLVSARFDGFAIFEGKGYWRGGEELSFQVLIASEEDEPILALIEEIKTAFRQESVIQIRHTTASVTFH
jgi:hypothetical protein